MAERTIDALEKKTAECEDLAIKLYDVTRSRDGLLKLILEGMEQKREIKEAILASNAEIEAKAKQLGNDFNTLVNRVMTLTTLIENLTWACDVALKMKDVYDSKPFGTSRQITTTIMVRVIKQALVNAQELGFVPPKAKTP